MENRYKDDHEQRKRSDAQHVDLNRTSTMTGASLIKQSFRETMFRVRLECFFFKLFEVCYV